MSLWWIGNIIFVAVVIPVVILLLRQVLTPAVRINAHADDIAKDGALFGTHLEAVQDLVATRKLVAQVKVEVVRFVGALDEIR